MHPYCPFNRRAPSVSHLRRHGLYILSFKVAQLNLPTLEVNPGIPVDVLELKIKSVQSLKLPEGWKPTDAATFVSYEFPFPHESHQKGKTSIKYGSEDAGECGRACWSAWQSSRRPSS